jgi:outer membrane protein TolC
MSKRAIKPLRKILANHGVRVGMLMLTISAAVCAQTEAAPPDAPHTEAESYSHLLTARVKDGKLPANQHWKNYVEGGKLRLSLRDAIVLMLENNSSIQVQETAVESQKFNLLNAHGIFDPLITSNLNINRASSPPSSGLQGVGTSAVYSALTQTGAVSYQQLFSPGTTFVASINSTKNSNNNSYDYFNPYYDSIISLQFTQPLLQNAGRFANTAMLVIARRSLEQSKASFAASVNNTIWQVIQQYWNVIEARGTLDVNQKSLKMAEASYDHEKRSLELGALPPLDIYRSQSEVAARKVQVIAAAYALQQAEEALRYTLGADQDAEWSSLELELTEVPQPKGELMKIELAQALTEALEHRPEIDAARDALANDDTSIRLAKNQERPNLSFTGIYQSNGLGGNQLDSATGNMIAGGFGSSMDQTFGFGYPTYGGALSLNLPVRNNAAKARLGSALVSRTQDMYANRRTRESITLDVKNAVHQLEEARQALAAGTISFDLAQKMLSADQRKYELGTETNYFVLDAQTRLAGAEQSLLEAQINYQMAVAAMGHATGDLLTPYRVQIHDMTH